MNHLFDRVLLFVLSLVTAAFSVFLLLLILDFLPYFDPALWVTQVQGATWAFFTTIAISALILLISIRFLLVSIKSDASRPPSVDQRTDIGDIRISLDTVRNLALKSATRVKGAQEIKVKVQQTASGIEIIVRVFVDGERSITSITEEVQQSVKEYVEDITGILVASVSVFVANLIHEPSVRSRVE